MTYCCSYYLWYVILYYMWDVVTFIHWRLWCYLVSKVPHQPSLTQAVFQHIIIIVYLLPWLADSIAGLTPSCNTSYLTTTSSSLKIPFNPRVSRYWISLVAYDLCQNTVYYCFLVYKSTHGRWLDVCQLVGQWWSRHRQLPRVPVGGASMEKGKKSLGTPFASLFLSIITQSIHTHDSYNFSSRLIIIIFRSFLHC